jgi:hypothetical protein
MRKGRRRTCFGRGVVQIGVGAAEKWAAGWWYMYQFQLEVGRKVE